MATSRAVILSTVGPLYYLLRNRLYRGEIVHQDTSYPGQHEAIVDAALWDQVQASLAAHTNGTRRAGPRQPSLLTGLVVDAEGEGLTPSHAVKSGRRYRKVEQQLDVHRAFLEELFATSTEAIISLSASGEVLKVNMAFSDLFGYAEAEVTGHLIGEVLRSDDGPRHSELIGRVLGGEMVESEIVLQQKDGSPVPVSILGAHVRIPHEPITAVVIYRDSAVRKQAEHTFRQMQKAVGTMQLGVTITDLGGTIVYTNPADAGMHGYEAPDLVGKDVRVFAPPGRAKPMSREQIESMKRWRRDSFNQRSDGSLFPVHLMSDVVRDAAGGDRYCHHGRRHHVAETG